MSGERIHVIEHEVTVAAAPEIPYGIIADVTKWPHLFPPTVHTQVVGSDGDTERIQLWAVANDEVRTWTSRREMLPADHRITFQQEVTSAPVASLGGCWSMLPSANGSTLVRLEHTFAAIDDNPSDLAWIRQAIDRNSLSELASVKRIAEQNGQADDLILQFADATLIDGPAELAYEFLYRCEEWPERLPHVDRIDLREELAGIQRMEMDTRADSGEVHTTVSIRVCFSPRRIVYKQIVLPPVLSAHTGQWTLTPGQDGLRVTSEHTVVINLERLEKLLDAGATVSQARLAVKSALSANSVATLDHAKRYVERHAERRLA